MLEIQSIWRLLIYKTENSKGNFTVFEGPLAAGLSVVPKESPWKILLITRTHLLCSRGNTDLNQLPVLLSQFKWTVQHTFHRGWMLEMSFSPIYVDSHQKTSLNQLPLLFAIFSIAKFRNSFLWKDTWQQFRHYKTNVCLSHSKDKNQVKVQIPGRQAALSLLLQLLLLLPSPEPAAPTGI